MHELGIAANIVEIVEREIEAHHYGRVSAVMLRIGKMTDVDHEALRFGFEVTTRDTSLSGAQLEIEAVPIRVQCNDCGRESEVERYQFVCDGCGSSSVQLLQGTELDVAYLKIDEQDGGTVPKKETGQSQ